MPDKIVDKQPARCLLVCQSLQWFFYCVVCLFLFIDTSEGMSDYIETHRSRKNQQNQGIRRSYDSCFKVMVLRAAEETNNCAAARKFKVTENNVRRWRLQKRELLKAHATRKAFRGPKKGRFESIDRQIMEYVKEMRETGLPISRDILQLKAREIARSQNISEKDFKASLGWCKRMMIRFEKCNKNTTQNEALWENIEVDCDFRFHISDEESDTKNPVAITVIGSSDEDAG